MAPVHFSELTVRDAIRYVLKREYRTVIVRSAASVMVGLALVASLWGTGIVSNDAIWGLLAGLVAAVGSMVLIYGNAYRQNLRFPLLVFRNKGVADVSYEFSDAGCKVRYVGVEATLPWRLLRTRDTYGEYEVLGFGPSETYLSNVKAIADAMSRNIPGPDLLGFPIFCAMPGPRTRYLFVPAPLLSNNRFIPPLPKGID